MRSIVVEVQYRSKQNNPHDGTGPPLCLSYSARVLLLFFTQESVCKREAGVPRSHVGTFHAFNAAVYIGSLKRDVAHRTCFLIAEGSSANDHDRDCSKKGQEISRSRADT